jgi:hypothetical protein
MAITVGRTSGIGTPMVRVTTMTVRLITTVRAVSAGSSSPITVRARSAAIGHGIITGDIIGVRTTGITITASIGDRDALCCAQSLS